MPKRLTQQEFIAQAINTHGDEYDYSLVNYKNNRTDVIIVCKTHGPFPQKPHNHVGNQNGCPDCYGNDTITTKIFIENAKTIHGDLYDYSLVEYKTAFIPVIIVCKIHGSFPQKPNAHTSSKAGCPFCYGKNLSKETFIRSAKLVHNDKYDYSEVVFVDTETHVKIICSKHTFFFTRPSIHLEGRGGCYQCAVIRRIVPLARFIERAQEVHKGRYGYSLLSVDNYTNGKSKIPIVCNDHGAFTQQAHSHLQGRGCESCRHAVFKSENEWLDSLNVPQEYRQIWIKIGKRRFKLDGLDSNINTVYEYNGDFYHGNPANLRFPHHETNPVNGKTFGELYKATLEREAILRAAGYNLITIWESDWLAQKKLNKQSKQ